jgi:hypothetical protein
MTCGSDFRLKKLYLFLHIFVLIFSRENSRLGTSPPMMKSVWSHLKRAIRLLNASCRTGGKTVVADQICRGRFRFLANVNVNKR